MVRRLKKKKKRKWVFLILLLVLSAFLIFGFFKISCSINKSLWDGKSQFNLVLNSEPVMIISFDYSEKEINVLSIPNGTFVEAIHGCGPYRVESLYRLGEIKSYGGNLLSGSLQEYFGVNLDGYLSGSQYQPGLVSIKNFLLNQAFDALRVQEKTNLTRWDLLRIWWRIKIIREDKIIFIDLAQSSVSQKVDLPDNSQAMKIDPERLSKIISQFFIDEGLEKEELTVAVLNKTEHLGLANNASKIIGNIGGRVIQVSDFQDKTTDSNRECEIKSEKKYKNSYTVRKLSQIFNCEWLEKEGNDDSQRAKVLLLIGEDYWRKLNLP